MLQLRSHREQSMRGHPVARRTSEGGVNLAKGPGTLSGAGVGLPHTPITSHH